jgi:CBS domain-containing protein
MQSVEDLLKHKGRDVWSISPDATVHEAARLMSERNVGAVLVCRGKRVLGILSERDCIRRVMLDGHSPHAVRVKDAMTTSVSSVTPHDSVSHCMQRMTSERLRHLPVMEGEEVVGLVSIGDVVRAVLSEQEQMISGLESYIHGTSASAYPPPF